MRDVLIRKPAHETVKVSRKALVALGCKASFTTRALIGDRPELYHLPADRSRRDDEIEGAFAPRLHSLWPPLPVKGHDVLVLAKAAAGRPDFHSVCRPQIAILPMSTLTLAASTPPCWFRSNEYVALLVVEISSLIDELEIGIGIWRPCHGTCQLIEFVNGSYARHCTGFALGAAVRHLAQKGTDFPQCVAVLKIVPDQLSLP